MQINQVSGTSKAQEKAEPGPELGSGAFLTLLVAQLRSQSPFNPMDPMDFVNQLVQFNMLDQTIRIRLALESQDTGSTQAS